MLRMPWRDHRGKSIRLFRSGLLPVPFAGEHPVEPALWRRIRAQIAASIAADWRDPPPGARKPLYWRQILWAMVPGGWMMLVMFGFFFRLRSPISYLHLALLPLAIIPMWAIMWWNAMRSLNQFPPVEIERAMLGESLCPQCGYPLATVPAEPDTCRICPECGAAWKLPNIATTPAST